MIYLSGALNKNQFGKVPNIGIMLGYSKGTSVAHGARRLRRCWWAADNGCYTNPDLDVDRYLAWLEKLKPYLGSCLFATAPDVVGNCKQTWERSEPILPKIRGLGFPAALVAQDGIEDSPIQWAAFDCLFIGGTTKWKLSAEVLPVCREALRHGKWLHMGRVNSQRRILRARYYGCQSTDGTKMAFGPDENFAHVRRWLEFIESQPVLPGVHE